jgi:hypothetical protein
LKSRVLKYVCKALSSKYNSFLGLLFDATKQAELNRKVKVKRRRFGQCDLGGGLAKQESDLFCAFEEGRLDAPDSSKGEEESSDFDDFEKEVKASQEGPGEPAGPRDDAVRGRSTSWTLRKMKRSCGEEMVRPYDLSPSMVRPFDNAVRYYDLARTMERPHDLLPAMARSYGHAARSYNLARRMARSIKLDAAGRAAVPFSNATVPPLGSGEPRAAGLRASYQPQPAQSHG